MQGKGGVTRKAGAVVKLTKRCMHSKIQRCVDQLPKLHAILHTADRVA